MQNHVDFSRFGILDEEVLKKTRRLGKYYAYRQIDYQKVELSLFYLWKLIPEQDDDILCRISQIFSEVTKEQNAQFIWARLCVAAYYFFHDEPLWQDLVFRKLEERVQAPELAADILTAKALIDEHYRERALLSGKTNVPPTPPSPMEIATDAAKTDTNPKPEDIFNFAFQLTRDYRSMLEVLEAEKKDCSDIEWARHALTIYRHKNAFVKHPSSFTKWLSVFGKMFGREVAYREPNKLDKGQNKVSLDPFLPR